MADFAAALSDFPPTIGGYDSSTGKNKSRHRSSGWCTEEVKSTFILIGVWIGVALFAALMIGIFVKREDLDATTRATVGMHDDTIRLKQDAEKWLKGLKEHFPANQEALTAEQVVGIIDRAHRLMEWADRVTQGVDARTVSTIAANVNSFVGNATMFVEVISSVFGMRASGGSGANVGKGLSTEKRDRLVDSTTTLLSKVADLIHSVSPQEFHGLVSATSTAVERVANITRSIEDDRLRKIVESASDILSAADTEHVIGVLANLTRGATEVLHKLSQPEGLRVSLPLGG